MPSLFTATTTYLLFHLPEEYQEQHLQPRVRRCRVSPMLPTSSTSKDNSSTTNVLFNLPPKHQEQLVQPTVRRS